MRVLCTPFSTPLLLLTATGITHQEPDAKLTEETLVMLVVLLVIKLDVVKRVVRGRQAHLTTPVQLKLPLFSVDFCLLQKTERAWRVQTNRDSAVKPLMNNSMFKKI